MRTPRSYDLFDTLAGRLHYSPHCIFDIVEKEFPFPGFAFYRSAAEMQSDGTLLDIYKQLQSSFGLSAEQAAELMQFEFEIELRQVFPIVENVKAVQDGDLIISDTYYDSEQLQKILQKIGLKKAVQIHASAAGKLSGCIWDELKDRSLLFHLGDNIHSDVEMPRSRGIEAFSYVQSGLSPAEHTMIEFGQHELAFLMRALRLQNPFPHNSLEFLTWEEQCQFNIPLLISSCHFLNDFCMKHKKERILFTARDGCLWIQLFRVLYPEYDSAYFHSSRFTYMNPSKSFIEYVQKEYTDNSLIVDVQGTGTTCEAFFQKHLNKQPSYLAIVNTGKKHHAILSFKKSTEGDQDNKGTNNPVLGSDIEKINADLVGALYDVKNNEPLRADPEYDVRWIQPSHMCIEKCVELLPHFTFEPFDERVVQWAVRAITSERVLKHIQNVSEHIHLPVDKPTTHLHVLSNGSLYNPTFEQR